MQLGGGGGGGLEGEGDFGFVLWLLRSHALIDW